MSDSSGIVRNPLAVEPSGDASMEGELERRLAALEQALSTVKPEEPAVMTTSHANWQ